MFCLHISISLQVRTKSCVSVAVSTFPLKTSTNRMFLTFKTTYTNCGDTKTARAAKQKIRFMNQFLFQKKAFNFLFILYIENKG